MQWKGCNSKRMEIVNIMLYYTAAMAYRHIFESGYTDTEVYYQRNTIYFEEVNYITF